MTLDAPRWEGTPFETKVHDTAPFEDYLELETAAGSGVFAPLDLTNATAVKFIAKTYAGAALFSGTAEIVSPATAGHVRYVPTTQQMTDVTPADNHRAEWEITWQGGRIDTIPKGNTYRRLIVGADLG